MTGKRTAGYWIDLLSEPSSFVSWDPLFSADPSDPARGSRRLSADHDSVTAGRSIIGGCAAAIVVMDYVANAGTLSVDSASQIASAFRHATDEGLPVVGVANSGGVRLQEGASAFVKMASMAAAVAQHRQAALPFVCYLANPTTGGALASWAGLADLTVAEPEALIAFAGPRVVELLTGVAYTPGSVSSEQLHARGLVDGVIPTKALRPYLSRALRVLTGEVERSRIQSESSPTATYPPVAAEPPTAWQAVQATRLPGRPGAREFIRHLSDVTMLHGDGLGGGDDPSCLAGFGALQGTSIAFVGHDRTAHPNAAAITPSGLRKAQRTLNLAAHLRLPLVSLIDTAGARLGTESELSGLGFEIARTLAERALAATPLVSVLLGEGAGGAALAFLPGDVVIAAANAWLAPLSPEGISAVLHRTTDRASEVINTQGIVAQHLQSIAVVDYVIPENGDWLVSITNLVLRELRTLTEASLSNILASRMKRIAAMGVPEPANLIG